LYLADDWMTTWVKAGRWYAEDHGIEVIVSNPGADAAKQQSQVQAMLQEGIDGLILSPVDSQAAGKIVDICADKDVPVINSNTMNVNPKSKMFVAFDNNAAAGVCADLALEYLKNEDGEPRGEVLDVMGPQSLQTLVQRREGFEKPLKEYDGINIQSIETDATRADAQTKVTDFLRTQDTLDVCYAHNPNMMLGAQAAMKQFDMRVPRGEKGHVYSTLFAANPPITDAINDGYVDSAVNQTPLFYGAIAIEYMKRYLESGKDDSVFPEIGTKMTKDDLNIKGNKHLGVNPWQRPLWAPANVVDITKSFPSAKGSYPYFKTNQLVVDKSNANEPWLWGNIARKFN
jgi:ABC-type sugar transport system substrate-binding protein